MNASTLTNPHQRLEASMKSSSMSVRFFASAWFLALLVLAVATTGCSVSTNLQSVDVSGTLHQPAVHLQRPTSQPGFRMTPWLSVNTQQEQTGRFPGHTNVNRNGVYQVDTAFTSTGMEFTESGTNVYPFKGQNFSWRLPKLNGGLDFDLDVSETVSLFGGLGLSGIDNDAYWSARAGIGFHFGTERIAARFDGGLSWETITSSAYYVRRVEPLFSSTTYVDFFSEEQRKMRYGYYGALLLQSRGEETVFFTQLAFGMQSIMTLTYPLGSLGSGATMHNGDRSSSGESDISKMKFISITPGIAFKIAEEMRLVAGVRFTSDTEIEAPNSMFLIAPLIQLEMSF
jgi:hypothetical protein